MLFHIFIVAFAVLILVFASESTTARALPSSDQVDAALDTAKKVVDDVKLSLAETDRCTAIAVGKIEYYYAEHSYIGLYCII